VGDRPARDGLLDASARYVPTLDGWRAVAIGAVILSHGKDTLFGPDGLVPSAGARSAAAWGRLGVDLFFAISGFLITGRLLAEAERDGRFRLGRFYARRAFRILPPYLLYLGVIGLAGALGQIPVSAREVRDCLLFVRNYTMHLDGTYTNHFWSLAVEEHFYLLWPLLLLVCGRRAVWLVPVLAVAVHLWRAADTRFHLFAAVLPDAGSVYRTDTRLDALFWGCEAALLMPVLNRLSGRRWGAWAGAVVAFALVAVVVWGAPMLPLWLALLFPMLVVSTVLFPGTPGGRLLEWGPLKWVGRMSYSLYLWQTLFLQSPPGPDPFFGLPWLKLWPVNLLAIFAAAALSYYLVERPMIRLGHRLTGRRRRAPVPEPAAVGGAAVG
jgi:peptidoglycan/LPS O-acetylase OafA/YrhL